MTNQKDTESTNLDFEIDNKNVFSLNGEEGQILLSCSN